MPTDQTPQNGIPATFPLHSALPILLFLGANRAAGLRWAVAVATAASIALAVQRWHTGQPMGRFMPIVTAAVLIRGAIGAATGSETLYFGLGIATKYAAVAVLTTSVLIGKPLAAKAAPYVMEVTPTIANHQKFRTAMRYLTLIAALYYLVSASFDVWLFRRSSIEGFVIVRFLTNWPLGALAIGACAAVTHHQLRQIPGVTSVSDLFEARFDSIAGTS